MVIEKVYGLQSTGVLLSNRFGQLKQRQLEMQREEKLLLYKALQDADNAKRAKDSKKILKNRTVEINLNKSHTKAMHLFLKEHLTTEQGVRPYNGIQRQMARRSRPFLGRGVGRGTAGRGTAAGQQPSQPSRQPPEARGGVAGRGGLVGRGGLAGRGGIAGRGRGLAARGGITRKSSLSKEQLDNELDEYMSSSKAALDKQLDEYMAEAAIELTIQ